VGHVGRGDVDAAPPCDLNRLLERADLHGDVVPNLLAALQQNPAGHRALESRHVHRDRVPAKDQRRARIRTRAVRDEDRIDAGRLVVNRDGRAGHCGTLLVGDDAADDGPVGTLREQGEARADAQAESGNKDAEAYRVGPRHGLPPVSPDTYDGHRERSRCLRLATVVQTHYVVKK
jgi:hypothetical protein